MAEVTAALIRKVREITGAGMSDVKHALVEADGDETRAIEELRKKGIAKQQKRGADRSASNGIIAAAEGVLVELACETDFVAKNESFIQLATDIAAHAAGARPADVPALLAETLADGKTVRDSIELAAFALGEKLELRRYVSYDGRVATYMHKRDPDLPPQIGVIVEFEGEDTEAARGAAMQVASLRASYLTRADVPADVVAKEREIAEAVAREEGKPEAALPRIVDGRVQGFFKDNVLLEQASVRDSKKTVAKLLDEAGVTVKRFARFEVGSAS